jgi:hypothetical protein
VAHLDSQIANIKKYFVLPPQKVNYLINIVDSCNALYFETPKVACTSIKKTLQIIESGGDTSAISDNVHDRQQSPLGNLFGSDRLLDDYLSDTSCFKFTFVRNPFTRVLSAYLDKFVQNQWEKTQRAPLLGLAPDSDISFYDFLVAISKQDISEMDVHWCPQHILLGAPHIQLDFIGHLESFSTDFSTVLEELQRRSTHQNAELFKEVDGQPHKTSSNSRLKEYYDQRCIELVLELYDKDFSYYRYSRDIVE